jgi:hypothetical protein
VVACSVLATHAGGSQWHSSSGGALCWQEEAGEEVMRVRHGTTKVVVAAARHEDAQRQGGHDDGHGAEHQRPWRARGRQWLAAPCEEEWRTTTKKARVVSESGGAARVTEMQWLGARAIGKGGHGERARVPMVESEGDS